MKIHLAWIRWTASAAVVAGMAVPAAAQYAPYRPIPQQPVAPAQQAAQPTPRVAAQQPYWQQAAAQSRYQAQPTAQYPQTSAAYVPTATAAPATTYQPAQAYAPTAAQYPASTYPAYPHVAYQPTETAPAPTEETMPAPVQESAPTNGVSNGAVPSNGHVNGYSNGQVNGHTNGYGADCNCNGNVPGYTAGNYYAGDSCGSDYGIGSYFGDECHDSQWFGGVYFLFMERDRPSPHKVTVAAADAATYPYFPTATTTVLVQSDHDFREGVEVRFGSTFTIGDSCDTCNTGCNGCNSCAPCPPTVYAWEVAWWGLDDDVNDNTYVDQATTGLHGMKNFAGLGYDRDGDTVIDGGVNGYYGYALPIPAASSEILAQRVRTNFKAQNLELNIIRFPVCDVCSGGCNSCDSGCDSGCDPNACDSCGPAMAFSMYGACGVRYFRADDDFMFASEFNGGTQAVYDGWSYADDNELFYDVQVDNNLLGPQLGWTMNYCYGCKWNFFLNSTFGVFANHIEQSQQMWSGGGGAVYFYDPATGGTGERFEVESDKTDISFLGELRLGGSYDITCNWRAVLAYRAVAVTGVATSTDNIARDFTNPEWVAIIDSDNSMVVHGVQVGVECRY